MKTTVAKALVASLLCTMIMGEAGAWLPSSLYAIPIPSFNRETQAAGGTLLVVGTLVLWKYYKSRPRRPNIASATWTTKNGTVAVNEDETKEIANAKEAEGQAVNLRKQIEALSNRNGNQARYIRGYKATNKDLENRLQVLQTQVDNLKSKNTGLDSRIERDKSIRRGLHNTISTQAATIDNYRQNTENTSKQTQNLRRQLVQAQTLGTGIDKLQEQYEILENDNAVKDRLLATAKDTTLQMARELDTYRKAGDKDKTTVIENLVRTKERVVQLTASREGWERECAAWRNITKFIEDGWQIAYAQQCAEIRNITQQLRITQQQLIATKSTRDLYSTKYHEAQVDKQKNHKQTFRLTTKNNNLLRQMQSLKEENTQLTKFIKYGTIALRERDQAIKQLTLQLTFLQLVFVAGMRATQKHPSTISFSSFQDLFANNDYPPYSPCFDLINLETPQATPSSSNPLVLYTEPSMRKFKMTNTNTSKKSADNVDKFDIRPSSHFVSLLRTKRSNIDAVLDSFLEGSSENPEIQPATTLTLTPTLPTGQTGQPTSNTSDNLKGNGPDDSGTIVEKTK